jgi:hypothetical protein
MGDYTEGDSLRALIESWQNSPFSSTKISNYFKIYNELFRHLRGTPCTFIETGILNGGSLFMWRKWLGDKARIIGIDLNPESLKWHKEGFEIYIGDQGDPQFWRETLSAIGPFDVLLDDGGHQSFQQIVTAYEAILFAKNECVIVIEDTATSFMNDFQAHEGRSFLEFAKDITDNLVGKSFCVYPGRFPPLGNPESLEHFKNLYNIQFFAGMVAFKLDPNSSTPPKVVQNKPLAGAIDFRYEGVNSARVDWPSPFKVETVTVKGGKV